MTLFPNCVISFHRLIKANGDDAASVINDRIIPMMNNSKLQPGLRGRGKKGHRRGRRPRRGAAVGKSTIHEFATCDSCEPLLRCIHAGADVNAPDAAGLSPLMHAVLSVKVNNVLALLEYGADVNVETVLTQHVMVHQCAKRFRTDFKLLLHGLSPERWLVPVTPLHLACLCWELPMIAVLLANGANPRAEVQGPIPDFCGTPLDFFARFSKGIFPKDFMLNRESTVDFLADYADKIDERVFRIYLHGSGMVSASSRATCVSQVNQCAAKVKTDLFGNTDSESLRRSEHLLRVMDGFSEWQKGGVARSLSRFMEYAKSSTRCKYNGLEVLGVV